MRRHIIFPGGAGPLKTAPNWFFRRKVERESTRITTGSSGAPFYSMNKLRVILFFIGCCLGCARAHSDTSYEKILGNMGNIDPDGLPRLSFKIVDSQDAGELSALGFEFQLTHRAKLRQGRTAGTEWSLAGLRTCAYIDTQGDAAWQAASGRTVRFFKKAHGYGSADSGATIAVSPDGRVIEITTSDLVKWRYRDGFLENILIRNSYYSVTTDREAILSISKRILNREITLLKCAYSKQGYLEQMEFAAGKKYRFSWSADHSLTAIDAPDGRRFDFEYANSLLTCWTKANGPRNELKWWYYLDNVRTTAFQTPPVLLREDAFYVYDWNKGRSMDTMKVYDKAGTLLSKTKIGATGMEQTTPKGKIVYIFE
jgi:hypothetical protein